MAGKAKPVDSEQRAQGGKNQKASEGQRDYRDRNQRPRNKSRMDEASSSRAGAAGDSGSEEEEATHADTLSGRGDERDVTAEGRRDGPLSQGLGRWPLTVSGTAVCLLTGDCGLGPALAVHHGPALLYRLQGEAPPRPDVTKGGSPGFFTRIPFQGTCGPVPFPLSQLTPSGLVILVTETLLK